jgi:hypothetical protein
VAEFSRVCAKSQPVKLPKGIDMKYFVRDGIIELRINPLHRPQSANCRNLLCGKRDELA